MKLFGAILTLSTLLLSASAAIKKFYNGEMRFFLADLSATYPCHPLYERDYTWIQSDETDASRS